MVFRNLQLAMGFELKVENFLTPLPVLESYREKIKQLQMNIDKAVGHNRLLDEMKLINMDNFWCSIFRTHILPISLDRDRTHQNYIYNCFAKKKVTPRLPHMSVVFDI